MFIKKQYKFQPQLYRPYVAPALFPSELYFHNVKVRYYGFMNEPLLLCCQVLE